MENKVHELENVGKLPERLNCPFCYEPDELCVRAAEKVRAYLSSRADWQPELQKGKMFGVLIVKDHDGNVGFLSAFSGILAGSNNHDYFVPPVYDVQLKDGYFRHEEKNISDINRRIEELEASGDYASAKRRYEQAALDAENELSELSLRMKADKQRRDRLRAEGEADLQSLIRESQFQKAEYKRRKRAWSDALETLEAEVKKFEDTIDSLRQERKRRSADLQSWLFSQFRMLNALGETKDLNDIFRRTPMGVPPAGAGECAAPKLLQYAYIHGMTPVRMAEFWWGDSPATEIRHHGSFYPSCLGKCGPILAHMLQGLDVEPNPLEAKRLGMEVRVVYEDDAVLVVDKPSGLLSVPGKYVTDSVETRMRDHCGGIGSPMVVHRLDQDTSGLLVLAKTKEAHRNLQEQFRRHVVKKKYLALLDGDVTEDEGTISLPLRPDPLDRPRQVVDFEHGKPAVTRFRVLRRETINGAAGHDNMHVRTLVEFSPETGRTHQLRVHSAHHMGLGSPICGDPIYGFSDRCNFDRFEGISESRLCLHAASLSFVHPVTGERLVFSSSGVFGQKSQEGGTEIGNKSSETIFGTCMTSEQ